MKSNLSETIEEIGRRGELEQEKLFYLLLNRQEEMRQELEEVPSYQKNLDFERLQYIIEAYRSHMRRGRDLFDQLTGWLQRMKQSRTEKSGEECENEYPMDAYYHMAVAEQEKDLRHMYPQRFEDE